ncbi:hypothetical protein HELRODRAFT_173106 [Helobdella robusta]|uniref:Uncharacterized protein n=1 Tax=Helobdella robusta TaxID=6412 RepID=T1F6D0_HELRO|nr:hypothetical protein HELRODRAFT_173106 [Helobdella robusta]ESO04035.1 hypothetical protein HELRODRAFT_173106 [Helobdella robusta]
MNRYLLKKYRLMYTNPNQLLQKQRAKPYRTESTDIYLQSLSAKLDIKNYANQQISIFAMLNKGVANKALYNNVDDIKKRYNINNLTELSKNIKNVTSSKSTETKEIHRTAPELKKVHNFWIKSFDFLHGELARQMGKAIRNPDNLTNCFTDGVTALKT